MPVTGAGGVATKYTLVLINFLFVVLGIAAVTAGGWVLLQDEELRPLTFLGVVTNDLGMLQNAAILMITSGIIVFALGILGCCGAYRELKCMLGLYIGLIVLVIFVTVAACAVTFLYRDEVEEKLLDRLREGVVYEYQGFTSSERPFSTALDYAQIESSNWTVRNSAVIPISCCVIDKDAYEEGQFYIIQDRTCAQSPNSTNSHIDTPCYGKLKTWMEEQVHVMGGVVIAMIVLEVLAIVFAVLMIMPARKNTDYLYRV
ncbi:hypothetical protein BaRGS_00037879 [Batillaria attramentaria]|uniref:Tetraspanin n=1 Tax=Batillaria attramentaria TaxID=370345 RepID=A0ABD0J7U3_9CAEN